MIHLRELDPQEWPPEPVVPQMVAGDTLPQPNGRGLRAVDGQLVLVGDGRAVSLGVTLSGGASSFVFDAWRPSRLLVCDVTKVWSIDFDAGHAEVLVESGGTPWSSALPLPDGALLTFVHRPWDAVQRWQLGDDGVWGRAWSIPLPRNNLRYSTCARGRVLVLHRRDEPHTWLVALAAEGLRPLCALERGARGTLDIGDQAYIKMDAEELMDGWFALEGIDDALAAVAERAPSSDLREFEPDLVIQDEPLD